MLISRKYTYNRFITALEYGLDGILGERGSGEVESHCLDVICYRRKDRRRFCQNAT